MTGARLLLTITIAVGLMCAAIMLATGDARVVIRWTARTSLILFALAYVARPATQLWPGRLTKRLLRERKWLGDGFAVSHLAHLAGIIVLASENWDAFLASRTPSTIFAIVVFLVIFAMAITSVDSIRKAMPRRAWSSLHRTGMHMVWIVFATTYIGAAFAEPAYVVLALITVAIALVRGSAWLRGRAHARARASVAA